MRAFSWASATALAVALCGCSGVKVRNGTGDGASDVHGIPFYIKVPWRVQETSLASREMIVVFTVTEVVTDAETKESKEPLSAKLPVGETLRLDDTPKGRAAIDAFLAATEKKKPTYDEAIDSVKAEVSVLGQDYRSAQPETSAHCSPGNYDMVANSWSTEMRAGTKLYYIEPQNPFIGSASADIHIGDDGTLAESSTSVTNQTASTVLSMIPVTAALSKWWDLPTDAAAAAAAAPPASAAVDELTTHALLLGGKSAVPPKKKKAPIITVRVDVSVTPAKTLYQLRQAEPIVEDQKMGSKGLSLCDALDGNNDVELVSIKTLPDGGDDKGSDKNAWQISGQLVPPKADKPGKDDKTGAGAKK